MKEELFEETKKVLQTSKLTEKEIKELIYKTRKQVKRIFHMNYDAWEQFQKENGIVGKYTDEEIINKLLNKRICDAIKDKENKEESR